MSFPITSQAPLEVLYAAPTAVAGARVGQVVEDELGGRWRYCQAGAAIANPLLLCGTYSGWTEFVPGATAVGSYTIACASSTDGTCTEDQYAGGGIIIGAAAANRRYYYVKGNTSSTTTTTTLTLYSPVIYEIAGTEWATFGPNPYSNVRVMNGGKMSASIWPGQPVDNGFYFWGKTRGLAYGIVHSTVPGAAADHRLLTTNTGGAVLMAHQSFHDAAQSSPQIVGYLIPNTSAGGDQNFMLTLE